jgi:hypothetical protein
MHRSGPSVGSVHHLLKPGPGRVEIGRSETHIGSGSGLILEDRSDL